MGNVMHSCDQGYLQVTSLVHMARYRALKSSTCKLASSNRNNGSRLQNGQKWLSIALLGAIPDCNNGPATVQVCTAW